MTKLTDTQSSLLSTASQRDDHDLRLLPTSLTPGGGVAKAIAALIKAGFAKLRLRDHRRARRHRHQARGGGEGGRAAYG